MNPTTLTAADPATRQADELFDYSSASGKIAKLVSSSREIQQNVLTNRKLRKAAVSVESLRNSGKLKPGETYISVKLIDGNIKQDMPQYVGYLKQGNRLGIFGFDDPQFRADTVGTQILETEFTRVLTYTDWEETYLKWIQGALLHGFDIAEVIEDKTKPGGVAINHVGAECICFDNRCENIQASSMIARAYRMTTVLLSEYAATYGFNPAVVQQMNAKLLPLTSTASQADYSADVTDFIYRVFFKREGLVFSAWYMQGGNDWLRAPEPFSNGRSTEQIPPPDPLSLSLEPPAPIRVAVQETEYPYELMYKDITEEKTITSHTGRGADDMYKQDAISTLQTSLVNTCRRASNVMWSPANPNADRGGSAPKQYSDIIKDGAIWDQPMTAHNTPWPDAMLFKAIENLATSNAAENNQFAAAVSNRKDTRKTAEELKVAQQLHASVSGVNVLTFSMAFRRVLRRAWEIIRSKAAAGEISFCKDHPDLLTRAVTIKPAGDVDYVERQQRVACLQQDIPLVAQTMPMLAQAMLVDYINLVYPDRAEVYDQAIKQSQQLAAQQQQQQQQITGLVALVKELSTDEHGQLTPQAAPHADELKQLLGAPAGQTPNQPTQ